MARDSERTQERILQAALDEFAEKGLAGARVDSIAGRAGTNIRMLYHYFGGKAELFDRVLREYIGLRWRTRSPEIPLRELIVAQFDALARDNRFVRLVQWEALNDGPLAERAIRSERYEALIHHIAVQQDSGELDDAFDPSLLMILVVALSSFPHAFPGITEVITGLDPDTPEFRRAYDEFLFELIRHLEPAVAAGTHAAPADGSASS